MSSIPTKQIDGDVAVGRNVAAGGDANIQGNARIGHDLIVEGWLEAKNIKAANKGLFATIANLRIAYPEPHAGWFAGVSATAKEISDLGLSVQDGITLFRMYIGYDGCWKAIDKFYEIAVDNVQVDNLRESLDNTNIELDVLKGRVDGHDTEIRGIKTQLTANSSNIEANENAISRLGTRVGSLENTVDDLSGLPARIDSLDNGLEQCVDHVSALEADVETIHRDKVDKADFNELKADVDHIYEYKAETEDLAKTDARVAAIAILPFNGIIPKSDSDRRPTYGVWYYEATRTFVVVTSELELSTDNYNDMEDGLPKSARGDIIFRRDNELYRFDGNNLVPVGGALAEAVALLGNKVDNCIDHVNDIGNEAAAINAKVESIEYLIDRVDVNAIPAEFDNIYNIIDEMTALLGTTQKEHVKVRVRATDGQVVVPTAGAKVLVDMFNAPGFPATVIPRQELLCDENGVVEFDVPHGFCYAVFSQVEGLGASFQLVRHAAVGNREIKLYNLPIGILYCRLWLYANDYTGLSEYRPLPYHEPTEDVSADVNPDLWILEQGEYIDECIGLPAVIVSTADTSFAIFAENSETGSIVYTEELPWSGGQANYDCIPTLPQYGYDTCLFGDASENAFQAAKGKAERDMDGHMNTAKILAADSGNGTALWCRGHLDPIINFGQIGFLPSCGQLKIMWENRSAINHMFALLVDIEPAALFPVLPFEIDNDKWEYPILGRHEAWWSSTAFNENQSWRVSSRGEVSYSLRHHSLDIRPVYVIDFNI